MRYLDTLEGIQQITGRVSMWLYFDCARNEIIVNRSEISSNTLIAISAASENVLEITLYK
jgi:hypothetical protein